MKIWATTFVVLFGLVELYQWVQHFNWTITLPLPVFILGGAALAIASNYDKRTGLPFALKFEDSRAIANQSAHSLQSSASTPANFSNPQSAQKPELPRFDTSTPATQSQQPISFTIQRSKQSEPK
uniref:hypothetical protein n=1 Tax=Trichocoleus desertorum TaxID=1481672 RepID=UPI0025B3E73A|nr:hypothetical protein [Trichocoleus desertorum]